MSSVGPFYLESNMPEHISISDFVALTNEDLASPTTSIFQSKMSECRNTVSAVEEVSWGGGSVRTIVYLSTGNLLLTVSGGR